MSTTTGASHRRCVVCTTQLETITIQGTLKSYRCPDSERHQETAGRCDCCGEARMTLEQASGTIVVFCSNLDCPSLT